MADERTDAALQDLEELEAQRAAGLVDDATAQRLWARYAREAVAHEAAGGPEQDGDGTDGTGEQAGTGGRWARRLGVVTLVAAVAGALTIGLDVGDRAPGGFVTGNEAVGPPSTAAGGGRDLSQVTNEELEQVIAQNPDIVPMRARLAHRYLDDGDLDRAVEHYLQVLDRDDHPEAMSHLGWILFTQGRADLAAPLLDQSRQLDPQDPEATWFQANLLLYGQDDPAPAIPLLEGLLRRDDLGETQRSDVETALRDAKQQLEEAS
jgi:cytochrome c-type biogenesis protein CcmH/NrfG